jgi:uncharacterized protein YjeT (DUF2065 family)
LEVVGFLWALCIVFVLEGLFLVSCICIYHIAI